MTELTELTEHCDFYTPATTEWAAEPHWCPYLRDAHPIMGHEFIPRYQSCAACRTTFPLVSGPDGYRMTPVFIPCEEHTP